MNILEAEKRNNDLKAKQLRRLGIIPVSLYGSDIENSLLLQITETEAKKLLRFTSKDSKVILQVGDKKTYALLREITYSPLGNQIENLSFQKLIEDEKVSSTAQIVLVNKEKIPHYIQQSLFEISYKAYPSSLIDKIDIDLEGMNAGDSVKVNDLDIAKNADIELITEPDEVILSIIENKIEDEPDEENNTEETQEA